MPPSTQRALCGQAAPVQGTVLSTPCQPALTPVSGLHALPEECSCSLQPRTYTEEELNAKLTRRVQKAARRQAKQEELKRLHRAQVKPQMAGPRLTNGKVPGSILLCSLPVPISDEGG